MKTCCPHCDREIDTRNIRMEFGRNNAPKCPKCGGLVRPYRPYKRVVSVSSLVLGVLTMEFFGVKSVIWFALGVVMLWLPFALGLNILFQCAEPFKLEAVGSPRSQSDPVTRQPK